MIVSTYERRGIATTSSGHMAAPQTSHIDRDGHLQVAPSTRTWHSRIIATVATLCLLLGTAAVLLVSTDTDAGAQSGFASVLIVLDADGDFSSPFEFYDRQNNEYFTMRGGQTRFFVVPAGEEILFRQTEGGSPAGFVYQKITCIGDSGRLATNDKTIRGTLRIAAAVTCTVTNIKTDTATITLKMDAGGDSSQSFNMYDDQARETFLLNEGSDRQFVVTSDEQFLFFQLNAPNGWQVGTPSCTGDSGAITVRDTGSLQGTLPSGGSATCTFVNSQPQTTALTVLNETTGTTNQKFDGKFVRGVGSFTSFNLRGGETITFDQFTGNSVNLEMFDADGWRVRDVICSGDDDTLQWTTTDVGVRLTGTLPSSGSQVLCRFVQSQIVPASPGITPVVTCLMGNGRIDVNVVNPIDRAAEYRIEVGGLTPRTRTVEGRDWWRTPITGRSDGRLGVRVLRDDKVLMDDTVVVACDAGSEAISSPEVHVINVCRNDLGFVAFQFANDDGINRSYTVEFGDLPNRSTSAAPFGASVRGVSGRKDGVYQYTILSFGQVVAASTVEVNCS